MTVAMKKEKSLIYAKKWRNIFVNLSRMVLLMLERYRSCRILCQNDNYLTFVFFTRNKALNLHNFYKTKVQYMKCKRLYENKMKVCYFLENHLFVVVSFFLPLFLYPLPLFLCITQAIYLFIYQSLYYIYSLYIFCFRS